jgi:hypothetical protein
MLRCWQPREGSGGRLNMALVATTRMARMVVPARVMVATQVAAEAAPATARIEGWEHGLAPSRR